MSPRLSSSAVSLEIELTKVGEKLVHLPSSTKEIIKSLMQTENILSRIALFSISIIKPLHVIRMALISEDLARHSNMVVKISVACCICEIMRIMAPNRPYDDNQMKEFFELVVTVFEKVSSSSGESYAKMIKVIETLSSGEIVVMMCHLQLDGLIERIFRRFLKVADSNSSDVVSKMEKIMTMIIKESKELPRELVNLLAMSGKSKNEIASPVRVQLAKKVLKNYVDQLNLDDPDTTVNPESEKKTLANIETPMPSKSVTTVNGKRKKQIQSIEHDENLVGSRIKVWWPEDNTYYKGTVKSFDHFKKKHKVWYDDGDKESIDLKKQKWELVKESQSAEHGENLVGSKIKVWWPADKSYYEGVVESFDRSKMKHKVLYDDGDEDVLNLNERQWILLEDVSAIEPASDDSELELPIKFLSLQAPAIKGSSTEALPKKVSSSQTPPKEGSSTQAPPEKVPSTQVQSERVSSTLALPIKDPSAQAPPRMSTQAPHKMVSATQTPTKKVSSTQAPPEKVPSTEVPPEKVGQAPPPGDIINVQGYSVKQSIAPTLRAIFKKHGDILADCFYQTASMRTFFLEVICEVSKLIESSDVTTIISKMEEIKFQVSEADVANIDVSWLQSQLEIIRTRNEALKKTTSLMEMKVNIIMVKRAAQTDLIERSEELVAAKERCVKAEECIKVLDKRADLVSAKPISTIISKRAARTDMRERCRERVVAQEQFEKAERCVKVLDLVEEKLSKDILESQGESTHG